MTRLVATRRAVSGMPTRLYTSELAFVAAQQSQAGSLAAVALHDLVLLVVTALAHRLRISGWRCGQKNCRDMSETAPLA